MGKKENLLRGLDFLALTATFLGQALIFYVIYTQGLEARDGSKMAWIITDMVVLYILYGSWLAVGKSDRIKACWERMGRQQEEMRLSAIRRKEREEAARQEAATAATAATAAAPKTNGTIGKSSIEEDEEEVEESESVTTAGNDEKGAAAAATDSDPGPTEQVPIIEERDDAAAGDSRPAEIEVLGPPRRPYTFPITSLAWGCYALSLCAKMWILFGNNVPQGLSKDAVFGPHVFRFGIGLATFVFSLLVVGHKAFGDNIEDETRNDYLHNLCYRVALEILDSASIVTLIMPEESHLLLPYGLANTTLILVCFNLFLPCVSLYKLRDPEFGKRFAHKLEIEYKILHLLFVDGPFLVIRLYLWSSFNTDTGIFIIKNIYALTSFFRGLIEDTRTCWKAVKKSPCCFLCREYYCVCCLCEDGNYARGRPNENGIELISQSVAGSTGSVNNRPLLSASSLQGPSDFNLRLINTGRQTSMSTRGLHGSASSFENSKDRIVSVGEAENPV